MRKSLEDTLEAVERIGNTPIPSKTVTSNNYMAHPSLEKSMDSVNQLHAVADKHKILEMLDRKADLDGTNPNMRFAQGMMTFESSGILEKSLQSDLEKSEGITILGL